MNQQTYRGGIIGLGFIGGADQVSGDALKQRVVDLDGTHLVAMQNHPRVEIVAGSSRDAGRRERFAQRTSARTYADWREMLQSESLDIVSIATYAPQHAEMAIACAELGSKAVWCEKPIAPTLADAEAMTTACQQAGTLLVINHNRRFHSVFRRLRDGIATGLLGELTSAGLQWGSGRLGNVGTHMFNALCMLTGRSVEAASATLDLAGRPDCRGDAFSDPGGWGCLRLEDGLITTFDAADFSQVPGTITINGSLGRATTGTHEVNLEFWDGRSEHWQRDAADPSSMDLALKEIVLALDGSQSFPDDPRHSVHTLETILACHASHQQNSAWVDIPLTGPARELQVHSG